MKRIALVFLSFLIGTASHGADIATIYFRGSAYASSQPLQTLNALYDHRLTPRWILQGGLRGGAVDSVFATWNYKFEATLERVLPGTRAFFRLTKVNTLFPTAGAKCDYFVAAHAKLALSETWELSAAGGAVLSVTDAAGSQALPLFSGVSQIGPAYLVGIRHPFDDRVSSSRLRLANYDIFDVYAPNLPFFQLDFEREFGTSTLFTYARYRFDTTPDRFNAVYFALGIRFVPL